VRHGSRVVQGARAAICIAALALFGWPAAAQQAAVIPLPAKIIRGSGSFGVSSTTVLEVPPGGGDAAGAARYLAALWKRTNGFNVRVSAGTASPAAPSVILFQVKPGFAPEGYRLEVTPRRITVSASSPAGLFYGAVTLWQLLPPGPAARQIAVQTIDDEPRYPWRGLLLDSARHFQSPAFVRSMIDWMAWHKLNVLQWHLTDDQGWRLQIRRYPKLTSVGAWRTPAGAPGAAPAPPYGGYYTQKQVREIVAFAATRHVQIIPEIDMPGHAQAAIAAYPSLGVGEPSLPVSSRWGVHTHLFNIEPGTFEFLKNVLDEVLELFPSRYVHIGGDEVVTDEWNASAAVQARARELGVHGDALQTYFTQTMAGYLSARGRRAVGWDEILQPGLPNDAVVMSWHGISGARAAAIRGNDTVLSPDPMLYLDHRQSGLASEPPGRLDILSLQAVYRFQPHDPELSELQRRHVLGVQANIWTEHIRTEPRVEWMALPRAAALAEVGWSAPAESWPDFLERLVPMFTRYRAFGLHYADSAFGIDGQFARNAGGIHVTLSSPPGLKDAALDTRIRYTLDGGEPNASSTPYTEPFDAAVGTEVRAATFLGPDQASRTWSTHVDARLTDRRTSHQLELCSNGVGLLLEPAGSRESGDEPLAVDIMNPCWIYHGVDLSRGPRIAAAVAALPFNYELGADAAKIRVGDAWTALGELEVHVDGCDKAAVEVLPLTGAAAAGAITVLPEKRLPALAGRHDVCLRFARPHLDPLWAINWVEIGE
jgi:hexosaminidase